MYFSIDSTNDTPIVLPSGGSYAVHDSIRGHVFQEAFAPIEDDERMTWHLHLYGGTKPVSTSTFLDLYDETNGVQIVEWAMYSSIPTIQGPLGTMPAGNAHIRMRHKNWNGTTHSFVSAYVRVRRAPA